VSDGIANVLIMELGILYYLHPHTAHFSSKCLCTVSSYHKYSTTQ